MNETSYLPSSTSTQTPSTLAASSPHSIRLERRVTSFFSHLVLIFFTVIVVYPVLWMVLASLKSQSEIVTNVWGLPQVFHWENYTEAWQTAELG